MLTQEFKQNTVTPPTSTHTLLRLYTPLLHNEPVQTCLYHKTLSRDQNPSAQDILKHEQLIRSCSSHLIPLFLKLKVNSPDREVEEDANRV